MTRSRLCRSAAVLVSAALLCGVLPAVASAQDPDVTSSSDATARGAAPAGEVAAPARSGELLVKTRQGTAGLAPGTLLAAGARVVGRRPGGWHAVAVLPGREQLVAQRIAADPAVVAAVPNYLRTAAGHVPQEVGWGVRSLRAPEVWEHKPGVTGAGVRVAVLDSGVDARHPQLVGRVVPGLDVYGGRGRDDCGHGTAVAGVIGAAHDGAEVTGIAPDVTIVPVKVLRYEDFFGACVGDDEAIAEGIRWAADPAGGAADIINLSLSGPPPSQVLADAVAHAAARGVVIVAAAGNAGDRIPNYPAAYPQVIAVGGLQPAGRGDVAWWPMSTFGSVDVAAPAKGVPVILAGGVTAQQLGAQPCPASPGLCADGTSFAAPHVAGVLALLRQAHPELATVTAAQRPARLRQWVLGTATDVAPTSNQRGVDLKTGHGRPDAVTAMAGSADDTALLLTWEVGGRILSPTPRMVNVPASLPTVLVVTTGTGEPVARRSVTFATGAGGGLSTASAITDSRGRAATVFSSTAAGHATRLTATVGDRTLPLETYVLQHDDNIPGVRLPPSPFRERLDVAYDIDDVYRLMLRAGETIRVNLRGVDAQDEYVDAYLHGPGAHDVTSPEHAPLRENSAAAEMNPLRLRRTVRSDGVHYVHLLGFGTYRAAWSILSPGKVRRAAVAPTTFTPNGDGSADTARVSWRTARAGNVTLRVRNRGGRVVRTLEFGRLARGRHAYVWDGRTAAGRVARSGVYRATVHWHNGKGRVDSTSAKVRLSR